MSVASVPYVVKIPYGVFNLDGREIKGVMEKPTYSYYANAGIYLIKKHCLELIPENKFFNATDFMDKLIVTHHKVIRYQYLVIGLILVNMMNWSEQKR